MAFLGALFAAPATAQREGAGAYAERSDLPSCLAPAGEDEGKPIGFTLPEEALITLGRLRESAFARAFLIELVLERANDGHWLKTAARNFSDNLDNLATAECAPGVAQIIAGVRAEARRREDLAAIRVALQDFDVPVVETSDDIARALGRAAATLLDLARQIQDRREQEDVDGLYRALESAAGNASESSRAILHARGNLERREASRDSAAGALKAAQDALAALPAGADSVSRTRSAEEVERARVAFDSLAEAATRARATVTRLETEARHRWEDDAITLRPRLRAAPSDIQRVLGTNVVAIENAAGRVREEVARGETDLPTEEVVADSPPALPGAPPSTPASVLWALTDFLIERAQDEVVLAYQERVVDLMRGRRFDVAFPTTFALFEGPRAFEVPRAMWRSSLLYDLVALPRRVFVDPAVCRALLEPSPPATTPCQTPAFRNVGVFYSVADELYRGVAPLEVAVRLPSFTERFDFGLNTQEPVQRMASLVAAVSHDLSVQGVNVFGTADTTRLPLYYLSPRQLLRASAAQRTLYAALTAHRVFPEAGDGRNRLIEDALFVRRSLSALATAQEQLASLRPGSSQGYGPYLTAALEQAGVVLDLTREFTTNDDLRAQLAALRGRWDRGIAIQQALFAGQYLDAVVLTQALVVDVTGRTGALPTPVVQLSTLAASLSAAKSEGQMVQAFRAAAMPAGGFRAKREGGNRGLAITAFPSLNVGAEWVGGDTTDTGEMRRAGYAGPSLPIGLELPLLTRLHVEPPVVEQRCRAEAAVEVRRSKARECRHRTRVTGPTSLRSETGCDPETLTLAGADSTAIELRTDLCITRATRRRSYVSIYAPILDLGALLRFRLSEDDDVSRRPDIRWDQVLAPGLYLVLGHPSQPITFGFGGQLAPQLRTVRVEGTTAQDEVRERREALQFGAFVGIDLTLLQF